MSFGFIMQEHPFKECAWIFVRNLFTLQIVEYADYLDE